MILRRSTTTTASPRYSRTTPRPWSWRWLLVALILLCAPAWPQRILRPRMVTRDGRAEILLGTQVWVRLPGEAGDRAKQVVERLEEVLLAAPKPEDVAVIRQGKWAAVIQLAGTPLVTVDRALSRVHRSAPAALASRWAKQLKTALSGQWVVVVPGEKLAVPVGESRAARIGGPAAHELRVSLRDPAIAQIVPAPKASAPIVTIVVRGLASGDTALALESKTARALLPVVVRPLAAAIPAHVDVVLTATPTEEQWQRWANYALRCAVTAVPGAELSIDPLPHWPAGRVRVAAYGPRLFDIAREVALVAGMRRLSLKAPHHVLVSNDPERVPVSRILLRDTISAGESVRVLWHHVNEAPQPLWFGLRLYNTAASPATVFLSDALAGPVGDELYAGHVACREYLLSLKRSAGVVLTIRPRSRVELSDVRVGRGAIVSGLATVQVLSGAKIVLEVVAHSDEPAVASVRLSSLDRFVRMTPFRFEGEISLSASYAVGDPWLFLPLGKAPRRNKHGRLLHGNYGVLYRMRLKISNPKAQPARVELALRASGGAARAAVLVDDELHETGVLMPGTDAILAAWTVPAGGDRQVSILAIPQAGSNYPVHLIVRPAGYR